MARFNIQNAENYGSSGGGSYFKLQNDHDIARVRFLYDTIEDVEGFAIHEIKDEGGAKFSKVDVNCLREYGAPIDDCPFCKSGKYPVKVKYYVPLYNESTQKIQVWERGKKFGSKLSAMCARYPHLVSQIFEIERLGQAGDQQTTYDIVPVDHDEARLEDFEEPVNPLGTLVLDKSAEDMQYYLDRGVWMDDAGSGRATRSDDSRVVRRTPANGGRRGESF